MNKIRKSIRTYRSIIRGDMNATSSRQASS